MAQEDKNKKWYPAIYARLSDEDRENKVNGVSLSIDHQIDILKKFVKDKGWQEPKIFYDDNRTGTNFNRKGFQDMSRKSIFKVKLIQRLKKGRQKEKPL